MTRRARVVVSWSGLALMLLAAGSARAQLGFGEGVLGQERLDVPDALVQPPGWLPENYFRGPSPGQQVFLTRVRSGEVVLPEDERPWSFDSVNGKHALLGLREIWRGGERRYSWEQSPLEKYDTLAAADAIGRGTPSDAQVLQAVPNAALWEANPANRHNRTLVTCSAPGGGEERPAQIPIQNPPEFLGDVDQVVVERAEGQSVGYVTYGGAEHPIVEVKQDVYQGEPYTYYVYHQDVTREYYRGAPLPPARNIAVNEQRSGGQVVKVKSWFTRQGPHGRHDEGAWGHAYLALRGGAWEMAYDRNVRVRTRPSEGRIVALRWGRNLEHRIQNPEHREDWYTRWESVLYPGRLPTREDTREREVRYWADFFEFDAGIEVPGGQRARNTLVLFPGFQARAALRANPSAGQLPERSGWMLTRWTTTESQAGVSWSGHCAGFAAASVLFAEPPASATVALPVPLRRVRLKARHAAEACVQNLRYETFGEPVRELEFENRDLKMLAIELAQAVDVDLEHPIRDPADREAPGIKIEYPRMADGDSPNIYDNPDYEHWEDVLPHNMHIILLDFLQNRRRPIVADRHPCHPVWNSPVYGYEFTVTPRQNPKRYEVAAKMKYAGYGESLMRGVRKQDTRGAQPMTYPRAGVAPYDAGSSQGMQNPDWMRFTLFLDADNRVTGSSWEIQGESASSIRERSVDCEYVRRDPSSGEVIREGGQPVMAMRPTYIHPDSFWAPTALVRPERSQRTGRVNSNPQVDDRLLFERYDVLASRGRPYLHPWAQNRRR